MVGFLCLYVYKGNKVQMYFPGYIYELTFWVVLTPFSILTCLVLYFFFLYRSKKQKIWQASALIKTELE